jgi:tryptophan 2,3-dioxygenase
VTETTDDSTPSYAAYLQLDTLLGCQSPPDFGAGGVPRPLAHHDEMLFIVVHQVYELWFKQILHELTAARDLLGQPSAPVGESVPEVVIPQITGLLGRVNEILRLAHSQMSVIETMPSVHFLAFRDLLLPASGFQSTQFREFEILAGLKEEDRLASVGGAYRSMLSDDDLRRLDARRAEMSFREAVNDWLSRTPVEGVFPGFAAAYMDAHGQYGRDQAQSHGGSPNLSAGARREVEVRLSGQHADLERYLFGDDALPHAAFLFIASYREQPLLRWPYTLLEAVIELEERWRLFRFRHARMVERMIGFRVGTGGSSGVEYLDQTAMSYRVFGELLEGRSFLLSVERLPELPHPELLAFRGLDGGDTV